MRDDFAAISAKRTLGARFGLRLGGFAPRSRRRYFIDLRDDAGFCRLSPTRRFRARLSMRRNRRVPNMFCGRRGLSAAVRRGLRIPRDANGMVELAAETVEILNAAEIPFTPGDETVGEEARLRHRVFDLRGARLQRNLRLRHKISRAARDFWTAPDSSKSKRRRSLDQRRRRARFSGAGALVSGRGLRAAAIAAVV